MDNVDSFWQSVSALTYAEMMQVAEKIRDAADSIGFDPADAYSWAQSIETARVNYT